MRTNNQTHVAGFDENPLRNASYLSRRQHQGHRKPQQQTGQSIYSNNHNNEIRDKAKKIRAFAGDYHWHENTPTAISTSISTTSASATTPSTSTLWLLVWGSLT
eukprot:m.202343 g.202343  ORF g.202343 m.202343 type:complete len:104 (-) comp32823_c0_seq2:8-319(-)